MTIDTLAVRAMIAIVNSNYKHSIDAQEALYEVGRLIDTYEDEENAKMTKELDK